MHVSFFWHRGYEINYFITGDKIVGYSASAKICPRSAMKAVYIPLQLPEHRYPNSFAAEEAIMQLCKEFIDEKLIESETTEEPI